MSEPSELEASEFRGRSRARSGAGPMRVAALSAGLSLLLLVPLYVSLRPSPALSENTQGQPHIYRLSVDDSPPNTEPPLIKANLGMS